MVIRSIRLWPVAAALVVVFFTGCTMRTPIADITRDPSRFTNKDVTISGQASDSFGAMGNGIFQVDDGTGRIWVVSQNFGVPGNGVKVTVTGRIQQGFSFGGRTFGLILMQTQARD